MQQSSTCERWEKIGSLSTAEKAANYARWHAEATRNAGTVVVVVELEL